MSLAKKLIKIFLLTIFYFSSLCFPIFCQETVTDLSQDNLSVLNEEIRKIRDGVFSPKQNIRYDTSIARRYYHLNIAGFNPGASGATWTNPSSSTLGGWQLNAAGETLHSFVDVHNDWDGKTNPNIEVHFCVNVDNSGGATTDTVDVKAIFYYKGNGETTVKTQTSEVATVVGASARYKLFKVELPIDWDYTANVLEAGDIISIVLNLETDTSEVDDIIVTGASFYYHTTHLGIEEGDA